MDYSEVYENVPVPHMVDGVKNWLERGILPGSFLLALLTNDFTQAVVKADHINRRYLHEWAIFMLNHMPPDTWGNHETIKSWKSNYVYSKL